MSADFVQRYGLAEDIPDGRPFFVKDEIITGSTLKQCDFAIQFGENGFWVALEAGSEVSVDNGLLGCLRARRQCTTINAAVNGAGYRLGRFQSDSVEVHSCLASRLHWRLTGSRLRLYQYH